VVNDSTPANVMVVSMAAVDSTAANVKNEMREVLLRTESKLVSQVSLKKQVSPFGAQGNLANAEVEADFQKPLSAQPLDSAQQQPEKPVAARNTATFSPPDSSFSRTKTAGPSASARSGDKASPFLYMVGVLSALIILPVLGFLFFSPMARARIQLWRADYETAARIYENVVAKHPQRWRVYPALANLYLQMGRKDEAAMKVYKTISQLNLPIRHRERIDEALGNNQPHASLLDSDAIDKLEKELKAERRKQSRKGRK